MPNEFLESLLRHPNPGFACYACGDRRETEAFVAAVSHFAHAPAYEPSLRDIPPVVGSESATEFYSAHDGCLLYSAKGMMAAQGGPNEGIEIFPIGEWSGRTAQTLDSWEESEFEDDTMPYGRKDFISFAHNHGAANYIHWVTRGPNAGAIYWWPWTMPPDANDPPLARNFAEFVEIICTRPVQFLNEMIACYTRFSDGKTREQWIPKRYIPDLRSR